jgi:hypothetical protein
MLTKPALQKIIKGTSYTEQEDKYNNENMGKNKSHWMSRLANEEWGRIKHYKIRKGQELR